MLLYIIKRTEKIVFKAKNNILSFSNCFNIKKVKIEILLSVRTNVTRGARV